MPFDGKQEANSLVQLLRGSEMAGYEKNQQASLQLREEAYKEFCKLSPENKAATITAFKSFDYTKVLRTGDDKPMGFATTPEFNTSKDVKAYISFDCGDDK